MQQLQDKYLIKPVRYMMPAVTRFSPGTQRGNPNQNDAYFSIVLKFAVRLGAIFDNIYDRRVASHMKCPARF